ncbi:MAG TPA: hypothetical protein VI583_14410 [Cyclobacteriaceae bacterium]|nr:hypothetical protein [Cyclobacteriaceae bacterium]
MKYFSFFFLFPVVFLSSCGFKDNHVEPVLVSEFYFDEDNEGWEPAYANYDPALEDTFRFNFGHKTFAAPGGDDSLTAIYQTFFNANNQLFAYIKRKIGGLEPNTSYRLIVGVDLYCQLIEPFTGDLNSISIGSYLKVGAFTDEPVNKVIQDSLSSGGTFVVPDFDTGVDYNSGNDLKYVGKIIQTRLEEDPQLLATNNADTPIIVTSDAGGYIWTVVGANTNVPLYQSIHYMAIGMQIQKMPD